MLTIFCSTLSLFLGCLTAARAMHNYLLKHVVRASQPNFFDVTPVGRILNRFSRDVDEVDNDLPSTLRAWSACFFGVFTFNLSDSVKLCSEVWVGGCTGHFTDRYLHSTRGRNSYLIGLFKRILRNEMTDLGR